MLATLVRKDSESGEVKALWPCLRDQNTLVGQDMVIADSVDICREGLQISKSIVVFRRLNRFN